MQLRPSPSRQMRRLIGQTHVAVASWKRRHSAKHCPRKRKGSSQPHVAESAAEHAESADRHLPDRAGPARVVRSAPAARASACTVFGAYLRRGRRLRDRRPAGAIAQAAGIQRRTRFAQEGVRYTPGCDRGRSGDRREYRAADARVQSPRFAPAATGIGQVRAVRRGRGQLRHSGQGAVSARCYVDADRRREGVSDVPDKPFANRYQDRLCGGPVRGAGPQRGRGHHADTVLSR